MKAATSNLLAVLCVAAAAIAIAVSIRSCTNERVDFYCTMAGVESFLVEDASRVAGSGGTWRITTESVRYTYVQRQGEACSVEKLP